MTGVFSTCAAAHAESARLTATESWSTVKSAALAIAVLESTALTVSLEASALTVAVLKSSALSVSVLIAVLVALTSLCSGKSAAFTVLIAALTVSITTVTVSVAAITISVAVAVSKIRKSSGLYIRTRCVQLISPVLRTVIRLGTILITRILVSILRRSGLFLRSRFLSLLLGISVSSSCRRSAIRFFYNDPYAVFFGVLRLWRRIFRSCRTFFYYNNFFLCNSGIIRI